MPHRAKLISSASRILYAPVLSIFSSGRRCVSLILSRARLRRLSAFVCKVWFADAKRGFMHRCELREINVRISAFYRLYASNDSRKSSPTVELYHCSGTNPFAGVYLRVMSWSDL